jgi:hypothetical protein
MSIEITRGPEAAELGLLTPEKTLTDARILNNAFVRLESRVRNTTFAPEFGDLYTGWTTDYNRLRSSYFFRLSEWGLVAKWRAKFNEFKARVKAAGISTVGVPEVVGGETLRIPTELKVKPTAEAEEIVRRAGEISGGLSGAMIFLGIAVAAGVGLWFFSRRRGGATAGMGFAGTIPHHDKTYHELIDSAKEAMDKAEKPRTMQRTRIALLREAYTSLQNAVHESRWLPKSSERYWNSHNTWVRLNELKEKYFIQVAPE